MFLLYFFNQDKVHPSNAIQPGEMFYYYSGDCNDAGVQDGIKHNFVEVLEIIEESNGWKNICPKYCTVEGLTVTCGPLNGRKRRSLDKNKRVKRNTNQITINFEILSEWEFDKDLWGNDAILTSLSDIMKKEVTKGAFNYNGTTTGNIVVGWTQIVCPVGQEPVYEDDGRCGELINKNHHQIKRSISDQELRFQKLRQGINGKQHFICLVRSEFLVYFIKNFLS